MQAETDEIKDKTEDRTTDGKGAKAYRINLGHGRHGRPTTWEAQPRLQRETQPADYDREDAVKKSRGNEDKKRSWKGNVQKRWRERDRENEIQMQYFCLYISRLKKRERGKQGPCV